ncbi:MAG: hypothetical protein ABI359_07625 [Ginsengibacter sp.]
MYSFSIKYKQVVINAFILVCLVFTTIGFGRSFFLGAASAAVLMMLGESIANIKMIKQHETESGEKIFQ